MPSFDECIQEVLQDILLTDEDRQSFNADAEVIRNDLIKKMKQISTEFKEAFDGLSLTGSSLDKLKIDLPDEFDMDMKLKLPFTLSPRADQQRPGFVNLITDARNHEFIGRKGKIKRHPLQMWLRSLFLAAIGNNGIILEANGRNYFITYPKCGRGSGVAHTVMAKEMGGTGREISFDFVPAFEFSKETWPFSDINYPIGDQPWFAIPFGKTVRKLKEQSNKFTFRVCAPHWERVALNDRQNLKNSLRLMKALRDANGLEKLASYTMKSIYLQEIDKREPEFWENSPGDILIEMLECLLEALIEGRVPFFLHHGFNQLNLLPRKLMGQYETVVAEMLRKLELYRAMNNVELNEVMTMFGR